MKILLVILMSVLSGASVLAQTTETWAFRPGPDRLLNSAILDLSYLNEDLAGETGYIRRSADGASFVRGDGEAIRFWAVNTYVARRSMAELQTHAKFLAKRGVNMVRFHGQIPQARREGGPLGAINEQERDRLWQLVSVAKQEGIYTTFSPYYPHAVHGQAAQRWQVPEDSRGLTGLIYFDPVLQEAYKGWLRQTLVPENPYTGIPLKDDPALAIIQMQNEDSLLFWTFNQIKGREARLIGQAFGAFLAKKYGSLDAARNAWGSVAAPSPLDDIQDDWDDGFVALSKLWHLRDTGGARPIDVRLADQTQFLTQTMFDWHAEIARFLRDDIGAKQLFNAGNWKTADPLLLDDLERYAYTAGDVIGVNRYASALHEGGKKGWAVTTGDTYLETGLLKRPLELPITLRQPASKPYLISETLWVPPMWQQAEGPLLMASYQALTGVDVSYWFAAREAQWRDPKSANGFLPSVGKWFVSTPQQIGVFPAAALIFRQGLIDEAQPVVVEHRALDELWARQPPIVAPLQGFDPNRDAENQGDTASANAVVSAALVSPYSFLTGPVVVEFDSDAPDYVRSDINDFIDQDAQIVTSVTEQLAWNWGDGVVVLDAPKAQGVIGDLSSRPSFKLSDVTIQSDAAYASIVVVPLDDEAIVSSDKLLVQIGSLARPTGWQSKEVMFDDAPALEVVSFGRAPWQINRVNAELLIRRDPGLSRATVLNANGMSIGSVPVTYSDGALSLLLPDDALYVVLE